MLTKIIVELEFPSAMTVFLLQNINCDKNFATRFNAAQIVRVCCWDLLRVLVGQQRATEYIQTGGRFHKPIYALHQA